MSNNTNRENAQFSTGPNTPEGKKISSQNALTHGLTARAVVLPSEDPDVYHEHLQAFLAEYNPQGPTEQHLLQDLADTAWRQLRIAVVETKLLADDALPLEIQCRSLSNLSLHGQRLARQFEKLAAELRDLQRARQIRMQEQINDLLAIMDMYEENGETYEPANDGFVFTNTQIADAIQARNRQNRIDEAREFANA
jgi:hypothetical protein